MKKPKVTLLGKKKPSNLHSLLLAHNKNRDGPPRHEAPVANLNLNAEFDHPTVDEVPGWEPKY